MAGQSRGFLAPTRMATFHSTPVHRSGGRSISTATSTCLDSLVVLSGTEPSLTLFERTLTPSWGVYMLRSGSLADRRRQLMPSRPSIVSTMRRTEGWGLGFVLLEPALMVDWSRTPLLKHLSYARTTRDFEARGLDGARHDLDEYRRASARTFCHISNF